jgi:hypothetical protein
MTAGVRRTSRPAVAQVTRHELPKLAAFDRARRRVEGGVNATSVSTDTARRCRFLPTARVIVDAALLEQNAGGRAGTVHGSKNETGG